MRPSLLPFYLCSRAILCSRAPLRQVLDGVVRQLTLKLQSDDIDAIQAALKNNRTYAADPKVRGRSHEEVPRDTK